MQALQIAALFEVQAAPVAAVPAVADVALLASVGELDAAARALAEALPPGGVLVLVTQASLRRARGFAEARLRSTWEAKAFERREQIAGSTAHARWGEDDEQALAAALHAAMNSATFFHRRV